MWGTASVVRNWLLVQHNGPWGRRALRDARLPPNLGDVLRRRERELGIRVILIRRPDRAAPDRISCFAAHTGPDRAWLERTELERLEEAAEIDLGPLGRGRTLGWAPASGPLFAVCTHGRRDPCCAERGRPLARALGTELPGATWESTHVGGDRFAGNMVAFPHGLYFGRLPPDHAAAVARAYAEGRIDLEHYRGRACYPMVVQAAEQILRTSLGLDGVEALRPTTVTRDEDRITSVFAAADGTHRVTLRRAAAAPRSLTCHSGTPEAPPVYVVLRVERDPA